MLTLLSGDPRRPYPTDLEMRSGMLGHMANLPTNGVNGHLPGDALAAGRLPGEVSVVPQCSVWLVCRDRGGNNPVSQSVEWCCATSHQASVIWSIHEECVRVSHSPGCVL